MTPLIPLLVAAGVIPSALTTATECHPIETTAVLARDVARVVPGFAQLPQDFLVGYVESSGAPKIFHGADLEHIAGNRGVKLEGLEDVCLARRTFVVPAERIAEAMRTALKDIPGSASLKIEIAASSAQPVPTGEVVFPRGGVQGSSGAEVMWRGAVQAGAGATYPVWARARITVTAQRVIATMDLPLGKPIQSGQIRVEPAEVSPFETGFVGGAEEMAGMIAKTSIQKGTAIRKSQVEAPADVARGDVVRVEVFSGHAHISMEARAETSGMKGSTVTVRNVATGRDFQARVAGKDQVTVGGQTE